MSGHEHCGTPEDCDRLAKLRTALATEKAARVKAEEELDEAVQAELSAILDAAALELAA